MLRKIEVLCTWLVFAGCLAVGVGGLVVSCTVESRHEAAQSVIDCTKQDSTKLIGVVVAMSMPIFNGRMPDWSVIETLAVEAGREIGGCALAMVVDDWIARRHPAASLAGAADASDARGVLERFRRDHAGGAVFRTAHGDL